MSGARKGLWLALVEALDLRSAFVVWRECSFSASSCVLSVSRHNTGLASVIVLFALALAVADQAVRASAGWGHAAAFCCTEGYGGGDRGAAGGGRRPRGQE